MRRSSVSRHLLGSVVALLLVGAATAESPQPSGPETQRNTLATGAQLSPSLAIAPDGSYLVVWMSDFSIGDDSDGSSIQGRRFSDLDTPLDAVEFQVNTYTSGAQGAVDAAALSDGSFVVVWAGGVDLEQDIRMRRFDGDGIPLDAEDVVVNTLIPDVQGRPGVTVSGNDDFVISWFSYGSLGDDSDGTSVQARRYQSDGSPLDATEFQVNTNTSMDQFDARATFDSNGDFVVVWAGDYGIRGRRFAGDGTPIDGQEFQVSEQTLFTFYSKVASLPDDGFVVTWAESSGAPEDPEIRARRFDSDATPLDTPQITVHAAESGGQLPGSIRSDSLGNFVVSFASDISFGDDSSSDSAQMRRFRANGSPFDGSEFQLNAYTTSVQSIPRIELTDGGEMVAVWPSMGSFEDDQDSLSIQGRRFLLGALFSDGFESGDTSVWSQTVP